MTTIEGAKEPERHTGGERFLNQSLLYSIDKSISAVDYRFACMLCLYDFMFIKASKPTSELKFICQKLCYTLYIPLTDSCRRAEI